MLSPTYPSMSSPTHPVVLARVAPAAAVLSGCLAGVHEVPLLPEVLATLTPEQRALLAAVACTAGDYAHRQQGGSGAWPQEVLMECAPSLAAVVAALEASTAALRARATTWATEQVAAFRAVLADPADRNLRLPAAASSEEPATVAARQAALAALLTSADSAMLEQRLAERAKSEARQAAKERLAALERVRQATTGGAEERCCLDYGSRIVVAGETLYALTPADVVEWTPCVQEVLDARKAAVAVREAAARASLRARWLALDGDTARYDAGRVSLGEVRTALAAVYLAPLPPARQRWTEEHTRAECECECEAGLTHVRSAAGPLSPEQWTALLALRTAAQACVVAARLPGELEASVEVVEHTRSHSCDTQGCGARIDEPCAYVRLVVSGLSAPLTREVTLNE